jgi:uncharacterized protein (TIGR00730 family)
MKVFIGCSSYDTINQKYLNEGTKVASYLSNNKYDLSFGACNHGIMGKIYKEFKDNNRNIDATCTEYYKDSLNELDCNKILVKDTNEQLKEFEKSDLLLFLPGGYGTYCEIFYMINSFVINEHNKKIILYNLDGYFDGIKQSLEKIKEEKFASIFDFIYIVNNFEEFKELMEDIC